MSRGRLAFPDVMPNVFEEPTNRRDDALTMAEPMVNWFTEVTLPGATEGRRVVNDLYSRFPDATGRMRSDLRSTDGHRFCSALDELYVYGLLASRYRVAYEEGAGTRPDFRLHDKDEYVGAVEVLTLMQRADWTAEGRHHAQLADSINVRMPLTSHSLMFDIRRWDGTPSVSRIVRWLMAAMELLQADPTALAIDATGTPEKMYSDRVAEISFQFVALRPDYVVTEHDLIVVSGAATGGVIDSAARLRDRLDTKAGKYQLENKPFAMLIGARDPWCTPDEVRDALAGSPAVVIATGQGTRHGDGFFGIGRDHVDGKHPQVSAVYSLHDWFPGGPYRPRITRFDNPFGASPFPADALPHGGHWGVVHRDAQCVRMDWLVAADGLLAA